MRNRSGEPVPPRLDEFPLMQAGALFAPALAVDNKRRLPDEIFLHPLGAAVPLNVREAVIEVNGPWKAVEPKPSPIPQLERENVRRGADFKEHALRARAVNSASRYQKMIVLRRGDSIDEAIGIERDLAVLRFAQLRGERLRIGIVKQAEIHGALGAG